MGVVLECNIFKEEGEKEWDKGIIDGKPGNGMMLAVDRKTDTAIEVNMAFS